MTNIAIFASGSGSNAEAILNYFEAHPKIRVNAILSNNKGAYVLTRAESHGIRSVSFTGQQLRSGEVGEFLESIDTTFIVLAGFLLLIPEDLIAKFKILNIHPALLPKYGGKGMYGINVHRAVKEAGDSESGMTIHLVDENYDQGEILYQEKCAIEPSDTAEEIASKVLVLEHKNYPRVIEDFAVKTYKI